MLPRCPESGAEGLEHPRWQSSRDGPEPGIEPFLGGGIASVQPDGQPTAGLDPSGDLGECAARIGRMMQDADRVDQVEGFLGDRQVEQVGLDDRDVGQAGASAAAFSTAALRSTPMTRAPWPPTRRAYRPPPQPASSTSRPARPLAATPVFTRNVASSSSGPLTS